MRNLLLTLGVLIVLALIFSGVNIAGIILIFAAILSIGNVISESIDKKRRKEKMHKIN